MNKFYKAGFQQAWKEFFKKAQNEDVQRLQLMLDELVQTVPERGKKYSPARETPPGMPKEPPGFGFTFPATASFSNDVGRAGMTFVDIGDSSVA